MVRKKVVHLFFTVDDNYIPFLSTTIASIVHHSSNDYKYRLIILHDGLSLESKRIIRKYQDNEKIFYLRHQVFDKYHRIRFDNCLTI